MLLRIMETSSGVENGANNGNGSGGANSANGSSSPHLRRRSRSQSVRSPSPTAAPAVTTTTAKMTTIAAGKAAAAAAAAAATMNNNNSTATKRKRSNRSEIDRLLSDEGTLNMLNSINTLVPVDQKRNLSTPGSFAVSQGGLSGSGVNLVVTPFRNMRGLNYKKKLVTKNKTSSPPVPDPNKESKIVRRRSSDNSSINSFDSNHHVSPGATPRGGCGSPTFLKRRSSLLSTLIIKEDEAESLEVEGNNGSSGSKSTSLLGKGISEEKHSPSYEAQSSRPNPYEESNKRTVICHRTDEGTVGQVTLAYQASNYAFTLNPSALEELTSTLEELNSDKSIKLIVVSSTGRGVFCGGADMSHLITNDLSKRRFLAEDMGKRIKNLFRTLSKLNKISIASLNGDAVGLGVTMLPLFDLVYASDKCTFKMVPEFSEGVSVFGSEFIRHNKIINSMVYTGRQLTAQEAMNAGLITEILWPAKFHEEVFLRVKNILRIHRNAKAMESLKKILTKGQNLISETNGPSNTNASNLRTGLDIESRILVDNWTTNKFQEKWKKAKTSQSIKH